MTYTFPEGFIPIGDAFDKALSSIKDLNSVLNRKLDDQECINKFFDDYEAIARDFEKLMRAALADGKLLAFIKTGNGQMEQLVDRESWRPEAFGFPVIESVPYHPTNPGPDTNGQPVFLKTSNFQDWLTAHHLTMPNTFDDVSASPPAFNRPRKIREFDSGLYSTMSNLLARGEATSIMQAATLVADQAKSRGGTRESIIKRLARGYSKIKTSQEIPPSPN